MSNSKVQIVPANIRPPQVADSTIYISQTNESTGLNITHFKPVGGQVFNQTIPLSPGAQIEYVLACDANAVISTPNSYWAYNLQLPFQCDSCKAQDAVKGPYGRYFWRDTYWWFAICSNTGNLQDDGSVMPTFAAPVPVCLAPMNSLCPIYRSRINYGGQTFLDEMVFRESVNMQALLTENYQAMSKNTWFDQNQSDILSFEIMPYIYDDVAGCPGVKVKKYCTIKKFTDQIVIAANIPQYKNDGYQYYAGDFLIYTAYPWFICPLNTINQIFDISNSFFISLLSGQQTILRIELNQYTCAQMFGTSDLFAGGPAGSPQCGIVDMDLVLITKTSEVVVSDEASKDVVVKFYPKYQWSTAPISPNPSTQQSYQITTQHNSVRDVILQLTLPDEGCASYGGAPYVMNDSTFIKQRCTLYNVAQLLAIQYGKTNTCGRLPVYTAGASIPNYAAGQTISPNDDYIFFYKINFDRGNNSLRIYSDWFQIIDQIRQEILRSNNYLGQYTDTPPRAFYNMTDMMSKYAFFIVNFENFSMDVAGAHSFVGMDGYHSKDGMIIANFWLGRYRQTMNNQNSSNQYPGTDFLSNKSYIQGSYYKVDSYQYYDEQFIMKPKATGNKMDQTEEIMQ